MPRRFGKWGKEDGELGKRGFYKIPSQPDLAVHPDGIVYSKKKQLNLENKFNVYVDINYERVTYKLHNLLAEAFVEVPTSLLERDRSELLANHKDGDKHNFDLDNLEWVDYSGNITHAYTTGLRDDNNRTYAMNVYSNEILDFYSQAECARFFDVDPANAVYWLKNKKAFNTKKGTFIFRIEGEEWPVISNEGVIKTQKSDIFAKSVNPEGTSYLFSSKVAAEDYLNIRRGNLRMHMHRYGSKPYMGFEFYNLYEYIDKIESENYQRITENSPPRQ